MDGYGCEWTLVTGPTIEPILLAEAKLQCRITDTDEDTLLTSYIVAARDAAEVALSRGLLTQTWKLTLPGFDDSIWLPMAAPLQSVTSVTYYDSAGVLQTLPATVYAVDTVSRPGRIVRAPAQSWPAVHSDRTPPIAITYVVGYPTAALVPERIKQGIRSYVSYIHCDREGLADAGAEARATADACWTDRLYLATAIMRGAGMMKIGAGALTERITILTTSPVLVAVTSVTRAGAVATVTTATPHGFVTGDYVTHAGADQAEYNVEAPVMVTSPTTYTFPVSGTPATPATGTITTVFTSDSVGGGDADFRTLVTVWAKVTPLSASEQLASGGLGAIGFYTITLHYRADLTHDMRIQWTPYQYTAPKTLEIHGIQPHPDEPRRLLKVSVGEVAA